MYENVIPLSPRTHAQKGFVPLRDYRLARGQTLIPIATGEVPRIAARLPIGLVPGANDELRPLALLGIDGATNLLVSPDGRWLQDYVPAAIRRYPFVLARPEGEENNPVVGIDAAADALSDTEGEALFTADGEPAERLSRLMTLLRELDRGATVLGRAAAALDKAGVVTDWSPAVEVDGQRRRLTGLKCVDESALNALAGDRFLALRDQGAIALAYAQLLSMAQLPRLVRLSRAREQASRGKGNGRGNGKAASPTSDELRFDFDA